MTVRLAEAKRLAERDLPPGHPGRAAVLALPDELDEASFDAVLLLLVRVLRMKSDTGGRPSSRGD
jgi:hypothetical protein